MTAGRPVDLCPVADGGEGTLEALRPAFGGELRSAPAHGPLGRPLEASFLLSEDGRTAIVETASASGLRLLPRRGRDPFAASTAGTGELIAAAVAAGARTVLLGVGGSATTDGGAGAIGAIERPVVSATQDWWSCATCARRSRTRRACSAPRRAPTPTPSNGSPRG